MDTVYGGKTKNERLEYLYLRRTVGIFKRTTEDWRFFWRANTKVSWAKKTFVTQPLWDRVLVGYQAYAGHVARQSHYDDRTLVSIILLHRDCSWFRAVQALRVGSRHISDRTTHVKGRGYQRPFESSLESQCGTDWKATALCRRSWTAARKLFLIWAHENF